MAQALFSKFRKTGNLLFLSGQVGSFQANETDPLKLVEGGIGAEFDQAIINIQRILEGEGLDLPNVVDVTVFLADMDDYHKMNTLYSSCFDNPYPTRTCVAVAALPLAARVELKVIAEAKA